MQNSFILPFVLSSSSEKKTKQKISFQLFNSEDSDCSAHKPLSLSWFVSFLAYLALINLALPVLMNLLSLNTVTIFHLFPQLLPGPGHHGPFLVYATVFQQIFTLPLLPSVVLFSRLLFLSYRHNFHNSV